MGNLFSMTGIIPKTLPDGQGGFGEYYVCEYRTKSGIPGSIRILQSDIAGLSPQEASKKVSGLVESEAAKLEAIRAL